MAGQTRWWLVGPAALVAVAAAGLFVERYLRDPDIHKPHDQVQYWAAARVTLAGGNPYDAGQLRPLEQQAGANGLFAIPMLCPPWVLPLILWMGWLPFRVAQLLWMVLQAGLVVFAADRLWGVYGGDPRRRWVAWLAAVSFGPTLELLLGGQITGFVLAAVAGFLVLNQNGRHLAAGAALGVAAIKPHLLFLVWPVLALEWLVDRKPGAGRVLVGATLTVAIGSLVALAVNPSVFHQYVEFYVSPRSAELNPPLSMSHTPTLGYHLRAWLDPSAFRWQFAPAVVGWAWVLWHWRRHRHAWDWADRMPAVLLAGALFAAYTYSYDYVLLLVPAVRAATWLALRADRRLWAASAGVFWLVGVAGLALPVMVERATGGAGTQYLVWVVPVLALGYAYLAQVRR